MKKRGRKSVAEQVTAVVVGFPQRPAPPAELTAEQAKVWKRIVASRSPDYFPAETHALLKQYCRAVTAAETIARLISEADISDLKEYDRLLRMAERQSKQITALARSMRLTHQSRYTPHSAANRSQTGRKPWEGA